MNMSECTPDLPDPVGARLAREGVITDDKSFAGKPRSYKGRGQVIV
jgi:hypothetical protein